MQIWSYLRAINHSQATNPTHVLVYANFRKRQAKVAIFRMSHPNLRVVRNKNWLSEHLNSIIGVFHVFHVNRSVNIFLLHGKLFYSVKYVNRTREKRRNALFTANINERF